MGQEPSLGPEEEPMQISQWLFLGAPRSPARVIALLILVVALIALLVVGLLALTSAFFPQ